MPNLLRRSRMRPGVRRCNGVSPPNSSVAAYLSGDLALLLSEMTSIHSDNMRDWENGADSTRDARGERQRRQDRLDEIRTALHPYS